MDNELFEKIAEFKRLETIPGGTNQDVDIRWGQLCHELTPLLVTERDAQAARIAELEVTECKAIEQSEYIQAHGLTEYEMAQKVARIAELTEDLKSETHWADEYHKLAEALIKSGNALFEHCLWDARFDPELKSKCDDWERIGK